MQGLVDTHLHTWFSHDSKADPDAVCAAAIERSLKGITVTDHCDVELVGYAAEDGLRRSVENTRELVKRYEGKLDVFVGIEMGVSRESFQKSQKIISGLGELDQIICSVHCLPQDGVMGAFSVIDFTDWSQERINAYMDLYYDEMLFGLENYDADILPHATCPVKYLTKYGKTVDVSLFDKKIDAALNKVIDKGMALELNASSVVDERVIDAFIALGGKRFTLASDAHAPQNVGNDFDKWVKLIKSKGINEVYYFKKRQPIAIGI